VQGIEDNRATSLAAGFNFAFVIGKSFDTPLSPQEFSSNKEADLLLSEPAFDR